MFDCLLVSFTFPLIATHCIDRENALNWLDRYRIITYNGMIPQKISKFPGKKSKSLEKKYKFTPKKTVCLLAI